MGPRRAIVIESPTRLASAKTSASVVKKNKKSKDSSITLKKILNPKTNNLKTKTSKQKAKDPVPDLDHTPGESDISENLLDNNSFLDLSPANINDLKAADKQFINSYNSSESVTIRGSQSLNEKDNIIPKPILAFGDFESVSKIVNSAPISKPARFKLANIIKNKVVVQHRVCISTATIADKSLIKKQLNLAQIGFNTYTERELRDNCFVLKNFIKKDEPGILQTLRSANIPVSRVDISNTTVEHPTYFVYCPPNISLYDLIKYHSTIAQLEVKWEKFDTGRKPLTQCRNCQRWGHAQGNCGFPFRCVCCSGDHKKGACPRQTFEYQQKILIPPYCVNCKGGHSANYKHCPVYLEYSAKAHSNTNDITKTLLKSKIAILQKQIERDRTRLGNQDLTPSTSRTGNNRYRFVSSTGAHSS
jgi:hypothetical protein